MTHSVDEVREFIRGHDDFCITGHISPDGDAVGSCLGLGLALEKMGKRVKVLLEPYHDRFNVIPGRHLLVDDFDKGDTLICVDCADAGRLMDSPKEFGIALCIDHHYTNTNFAKLNFVDGTASSACEMVYRVLDGFAAIDADAAAALYAGMVSDTGGFRHNATGQATLQASAKLMATGIPFTEIYTELVHLKSYTELKLLGRVLDASKRSADGKVVYACVTKEIFAGASVADLEGVVEILLNTRGAKVSVLAYEREKKNDVKVSLRSRSVSVGDVALKFGGGGHQFAAGANVAGGSVFEVCEKVLVEVHDALSRYS